MEIEESKSIVEVSEFKEANEYLQLGWILLNHYVETIGSVDARSQRIRYVLVWQKPDVAPPHPERTNYIKRPHKQYS